jgi:hypothetical protein
MNRSFRGGLLPAIFPALNRRPQRFDGQSCGVLLPRRQTAKGADDFLPLQPERVLNSHSLQHLRKGGTAGKCRRAAVGEKSRGLDAAITHAQTQTQAIAADWICFFSYCVGVGEFTRVARIREVILEGF